ncbi:MAG: hypothetical protein DBX66_02855 [Clostridiales bacterium]|uniref:substrate-binding periplasmic protein n=1 Tax=Provencibacterium massiliense TaxID=1841868 RepID=UPI0009A62D75|nr:transporter substrate-binding domain-containing protein [Provencibacterium massiliense]PWM39022.1 MAG: hypothetical protein DBX66_02855 [Clostridiales bacterium]RGB69750.1 hypothetical protein DW086_01030 [Harryflintia acetispora]
MKKWTVFLLAAVAAAGLLAGCQGSQQAGGGGLFGPKKLTVGVNASLPPLSFEENGEATGFDVEYVRELASRMGMEAKIETVDWQGKAQALGEGKVELLIGGLTASQGGDLLLTKPYRSGSQVIMTTDYSGITRKKDLAGKRLGLCVGSAGEGALGADEAASQIGELMQYPDSAAALAGLREGRVDAVLVDGDTARYLAKEEPGYLILPEEFSGEQYVIALQSGNDKLLGQVEAAMDEMEADGFTGTLIAKWFPGAPAESEEAK